jgi:DNA-binding Lrp family transcriptional regulator
MFTIQPSFLNNVSLECAFMTATQVREKELSELAIDDIDRKILDMMRSNARISLTSISKRLSLSKSAVKYRLDRLVRSGVIRSFFALVDSAVYGLKLSVVFDLTIEPQMIQEAAEKLSAYSEVMRVYELTNSPELHVHGLFKDNNQLEQFIHNKLYTIKGIHIIKSGMIMKRYKTELSLTI